MTSQKDMYISANILIKQYGYKGALKHADGRIDELYYAGDKRGAVVWGGIKRAIEQLWDIKSDKVN